MSKFTKRFLNDQSGATAIEYGLIAALVAVALVTALNLMSAKLATAFDAVRNALP
jgi:pilus assembly protein Flp/PilA